MIVSGDEEALCREAVYSGQQDIDKIVTWFFLQGCACTDSKIFWTFFYVFLFYVSLWFTGYLLGFCVYFLFFSFLVSHFKFMSFHNL